MRGTNAAAIAGDENIIGEQIANSQAGLNWSIEPHFEKVTSQALAKKKVMLVK
jgi:hypothetical protein